MSPLKRYLVAYQSPGRRNECEFFACAAESAEHALEQATNAYPGDRILAATELEFGALIQAPGPDGETDYILKDAQDGCWVQIDNISVCLRRTDEGVVADLYPLGNESNGTLTSTYAFFSEAAESLGDPEDVTALQQKIHELGPAAATVHARVLDEGSRERVLAAITAVEEGA